jgi:hypothetical protein
MGCYRVECAGCLQSEHWFSDPWRWVHDNMSLGIVENVGSGVLLATPRCSHYRTLNLGIFYFTFEAGSLSYLCLASNS